ncbi:MAG: hypothetical protein U5K38_10555 [Woeseiaceae bacterium]|nr:hypothetical protein [Woeseiaceae bacterium]
MSSSSRAARPLAGFDIPASGDGAFSISVDLDLINSAAGLTSILGSAAARPVPYCARRQSGGRHSLHTPAQFPQRWHHYGARQAIETIIQISAGREESGCHILKSSSGPRVSPRPAHALAASLRAQRGNPVLAG